MTDDLVAVCCCELASSGDMPGESAAEIHSMRVGVESGLQDQTSRA